MNLAEARAELLATMWEAGLDLHIRLDANKLEDSGIPERVLAKYIPRGPGGMGLDFLHANEMKMELGLGADGITAHLSFSTTTVLAFIPWGAVTRVGGVLPGTKTVAFILEADNNLLPEPEPELAAVTALDKARERWGSE